MRKTRWCGFVLLGTFLWIGAAVVVTAETNDREVREKLWSELGPYFQPPTEFAAGGLARAAEGNSQTLERLDG